MPDDPTQQPQSPSILQRVGAAFGNASMDMARQRSEQQWQATQFLAKRDLDTLDQQAEAGNVEFFRNPETLKQIKKTLGPDTAEHNLAIAQMRAEQVQNHNQLKSNIAKFAAQLGQTQQRGGMLAPNAIPTLVGAGAGVGIKPTELTAMGLRTGPSEAQKAGERTTAEIKAKTSPEAIKAQAQLRAAEGAAGETGRESVALSDPITQAKAAQEAAITAAREKMKASIKAKEGKPWTAKDSADLRSKALAQAKIELAQSSFFRPSGVKQATGKAIQKRANEILQGLGHAPNGSPMARPIADVVEGGAADPLIGQATKYPEGSTHTLNGKNYIVKDGKISAYTDAGK